MRDELDLSAILAAYDDERTQPPYYPVMMTALSLSTYCQGVYASRRIAQVWEHRLDFMAVTAMERPDSRTVSDYRATRLRPTSWPWARSSASTRGTLYCPSDAAWIARSFAVRAASSR